MVYNHSGYVIVPLQFMLLKYKRVNTANDKYYSIL